MQLHGEIEWKQIGMGGGGQITALEYDPFDENIVYMGSDVAGIFRSDNGGKSWKTLMTSTLEKKFPFGVIYTHHIAFDPNTEGTVFMLTTGGVFKSDDRGENWQMLIKNENIQSNLVFSPFHPKQAMCGSGVFNRTKGKGAIYKSKDAGATWYSIHNTGIPVNVAIRNIAYAPWQKDLVYAGTSEGLYQSNDGGENWKAMKEVEQGKRLNIYTIRTLIYKNKNAIVISARDLAEKQGRMYRSFDVGNTWECITESLPDNVSRGSSIAYGFVCNKKTGNLYLPIYRGWKKAPGVWKGHALGERWEKLTNNANMLIGYWGGSYAECVAVSEDNPDNMIMGFTSAFRSNDGGATWMDSTSKILSKKDGFPTLISLGFEMTYAWSLVFNPNNSKLAAANFQDIGRWNYNHESDSFTKTASLHGGSYHGCVQNVIFDPAHPNYYYAAAGMGYSLGKPRRSRALIGGSKFLKTRHGNNKQLTGFTSQHGKIVKVTLAKGKETYEVVKNLPDQECFLAMDFFSPINKRHYYAAFVDQGIYRSKNGGTDYEKVVSSIHGRTLFYRIHCFGKKRPAVYVIICKDISKKKEAGLFRSFDQGKTWEVFFDASKYGAPYGIAEHPNDEDTFYVASGYKEAPRRSLGFSEGGGVYVTRDSGKNWERILKQPFVTSVAIDKKNPKRLLASSTLRGGSRNYKEADAGIYYSIDGGKEWTLERDGLGGTYFTFVEFNPFDNNIFYTGTLGSGLYKGVYKGQ